MRRYQKVLFFVLLPVLCLLFAGSASAAEYGQLACTGYQLGMVSPISLAFESARADTVSVTLNWDGSPVTREVVLVTAERGSHVSITRTTTTGVGGQKDNFWLYNQYPYS